MLSHWINGRGIPEPGEALEIVDPATEAVVELLPRGSADLADAAVEAAAKAGPAWAALSPAERRNLLLPAVEKLVALRQDVAALITREMGKPLSQALAEVGTATDVARQFCDLAVHLRSGSQMAALGELNFQQRVPRGVCACILPWNFPAVVAMENVVPNLLVGNTVVWKPSEKSPLSARFLAEHVFGHLPPGVLNLALGDGANMGERLISHSDVDLIVFIGSERTGRHIAEVAARSFKKVILELGGKDPLIVDETVDIGRAARLAAEATFYNAGQICTSTERLFIARQVFEPFVDELVRASRALRIGNGMEDGVDIGPLVDRRQLDIVSAQVTHATEAGARVLSGGERHGNRGFFYPATVLVDVPHDASVVVEETFGPVAPCIPFDDFGEALALANGSRYGLAAIVCTASAPRALKALHTLDAGMIRINTMRGKAAGGTSEPFGSSGMGHGYGLEFLMELTRQKSIFWRGEPR
ncbi:aldehyde dehydrogenase family protein [Chelativorans sp. AA-79]|uniref:aldehyde dehydrogenase family protein n=1 Tax=Chelativorans sp. AA-79 TaxID=3028735 RepID=UPI0023F71C44|nr:aldehyde dehydrogenase family protein [Chelativorans sp. AA-79]WEX12426.1 aldehyde dehydrogenase family protein [Chelativorans sp. AA-79]